MRKPGASTFILLAAVLATACTSRVAYERQPAFIPAGAININTASVEDLERLPRVGVKTAEAIVRFREQHGPFRRTEHLMQVRGISEKRFIEIRSMLSVE